MCAMKKATHGLDTHTMSALLRYNNKAKKAGLKEKITPEQFRWKLDICRGNCEVCGKTQTDQRLSPVPQILFAEGGKNTIHNMVLACRSCGHCVRTIPLHIIREKAQRKDNWSYCVHCKKWLSPDNFYIGTIWKCKYHRRDIARKRRREGVVPDYRRCLFCNKVFPVQHRNHYCCCRTCRRASLYDRNKRANPLPKNICAGCGKLFPPRRADQIYCSSRCNNVMKRKRAKERERQIANESIRQT